MTIRVEGEDMYHIMRQLPQQPRHDVTLAVTPLMFDFKRTGKAAHYRVHCKNCALVSQHENIEDAIKEIRKHAKEAYAL